MANTDNEQFKARDEHYHLSEAYAERAARKASLDIEDEDKPRRGR